MQVSIAETTFECSELPVCFLRAQLHNPSVASVFRKVPSREGTDPQGLQSTGTPAMESEQVYTLKKAASATGRDQGLERQNPSPHAPRQDQSYKTIPAIQHWTIILELNLTYI